MHVVGCLEARCCKSTIQAARELFKGKLCFHFVARFMLLKESTKCAASLEILENCNYGTYDILFESWTLGMLRVTTDTFDDEFEQVQQPPKVLFEDG